jgi:hypothetical protein
VSCPINNSLAAPRLFAPGGVAPPRPCPVYISDSSARLARHVNPRADRASYLWDRTRGLELLNPGPIDRAPDVQQGNYFVDGFWIFLRRARIEHDDLLMGFDFALGEQHFERPQTHGGLGANR